MKSASCPAHFVTVGGQTRPDQAQFGLLLGKFPATELRPGDGNCCSKLYEQEKLPAEEFNSFVLRAGIERLKADPRAVATGSFI